MHVELMREEYNYVTSLKREHGMIEGLIRLGMQCKDNGVDPELLIMARPDFEKLKAEGNI